MINQLGSETRNELEAAAQELGRFAAAGIYGALAALIASRDISVVDPLMAWCRANWTISDHNYHKWCGILETLGAIGSPRSLEAFSHALDVGGAATTLSAVEALARGNLTDPAVIPPVVRVLLFSRDPQVRETAKLVLERYGNAGIAQVSAALEENKWEDDDVPTSAYEFLVTHGETKLTKVLIRLATEANDAVLNWSRLSGRYARWAIEQLTLLLENRASRLGLDDLNQLAALQKSLQIYYHYDEETNGCSVTGSGDVDCSRVRALATKALHERGRT